MQRTRITRRRNGRTFVEFAIASTVFFLLLFGVLEFGRAVYQYNVIAHAGKAAVRYAAVRGSSSGQTAVTDSALSAYIDTQLLGISAVDSISWTPDTKQGSTVQVIIRGSYSPSFPFFSSRTLTMRSVSQMVVVR